MSKLTAPIIKEAAKNAMELIEEAPPEVKMVLENPTFATGLCLVLHKELVKLRKEIQDLKSATENRAPEPAMSAGAKPEGQQQQPAEQTARSGREDSKSAKSSGDEVSSSREDTEADKIDLFS